MTNPSAVDSARVSAVVHQAWRSALLLDELPDDANFFLLGGDSLTAVMVAAEVRDQLGAEIGLADLLEAPTVGEFAERVRAAVAADAA
jgi:acyl carrier protein